MWVYPQGSQKVVDRDHSTFTVENSILLLERGLTNLIIFFLNSRVSIELGFFSVSRFSGPRNSENMFILMIANENRKLSNENKFFHKTRPKTDGDTLKSLIVTETNEYLVVRIHHL